MLILARGEPSTASGIVSHWNVHLPRKILLECLKGQKAATAFNSQNRLSDFLFLLRIKGLNVWQNQD